jgi:hypothetical protein
MALTQFEIFMRSVQKTESCWLWLGTKNRKGYGRFQYKWVRRPAHTVSYFLHTGDLVLAPMELDHLCRNTSCVNPNHLEPVTHQENVRRASKTHCKWGHAFTPENTLTWTSKRGETERLCKQCRRRRKLVTRARAKAKLAQRRAA